MNLQELLKVDCYCPVEGRVGVIDSRKCRDHCKDNKCLFVCPAGLFEERDGEVSVKREGVCLECGACRLVCDNIFFDYPPAGKGIIHQFG